MPNSAFGLRVVPDPLHGEWDVVDDGEFRAAFAEGRVPVGASGVVASAIEAPASTNFQPFQTIWLFELTCDAAGSATVTLSGVRRDDASTEVIATYNLIASQTLVDANDRTDHSSFSWTKTGTGAVTARVL